MTTAEVAADILLLLRRGRVGPALSQLERLPGLIRREALEAAAEGYLEGQRALAAELTHGKPKRSANTTRASHSGRTPNPKVPPRHEWLAELVADPALRRRALDVLGVREADLDVVLEGRAQLSSTQWRLLRRELEK